MNALHYGLTPKMKPISPHRSAVVAALDIGSSKIACLIARLRPHGPQQVLTRRSHAVEVIGFGHTAARGMKAGGVVNLAQVEEGIRQAVDAAERMAAVEIESVILPISSGRLSGELFGADVDIVGSGVSEGDIARVLAAGSRHSQRTAAPCCIRCRSVIRSTATTASATRAACSAAASASTCMWRRPISPQPAI